ncbi:MAG: putative baseplate assembly protein [Acidobacteria bacterium]|nr:putative baseplate assembly protein [Acidobacteriota bacterium]
MTAAKDRSLNGLTECGCCEGRRVAVPAEIYNRAGLKAIAYRIGTHPQFKESLLSRLSSADFSTLKELTTRKDDDFTIALLDAWATVADVLTFYQERIANESYLRTATEKRSIHELGRLTGYALSPGVAATAYLAFTLEEAAAAAGSAASAAGSTSPAVSAAIRKAAAMVPESVTIAAGTKVQSIPGQDEEAQIFETIEPITACPEWNRIRPQLKQKQNISAKGSSSVAVKGISLQLKPGDHLLLVCGQEKALRQIEEVFEDSAAKTTNIKLIVTNGSLLSMASAASKRIPYMMSSIDAGSEAKAPAVYQRGKASLDASTKERFPGKLLSENEPQAFVMRARASLFGYNAVSWKLLPKETRALICPSSPDSEWPLTPPGSNVDLDSIYSKIIPDSWAVIAPEGDTENAALARVQAVQDTTASNYGMSSKVTRLNLDQSISVKSMDQLRKMVVYAESEPLTLADLPRMDSVEGSSIELDGIIEGLKAGQLLIVSGEIDGSSGSYSSELVVIQSASTINNRTVLSLKSGLNNKYKRDTVRINGNVAPATHGETVHETLGSGDAGQAFQSFRLKQTPLTYLTDSSPSGAASTLKVYVNDLLWSEAETLLSSRPEDRHYIVRTDSDGKTAVQFGDGINGARLPTGQSNVTATYRKGIGLAGRVKKDKLSLLLTRSYGLKEVTNPIDADGGDDPETADSARTNVPLKVTTLDRVVSLRDYEDFARGFSGIAKALANWTWFDDRKGVFLTVAQSQSKTSASTAPAASGSTLLKKLGDALSKAAPPFVRFQIKQYRPATFRVALRVKVLPEYQEDKVKNAAEKALRDSFSFANRAFGQPVHLSEIMSVVQGVAGVGGVDVDRLYRSDDQNAGLNDRLPAAGPAKDQAGSMVGAELLTLHPDPLDELGVMP